MGIYCSKCFPPHLYPNQIPSLLFIFFFFSLFFLFPSFSPSFLSPALLFSDSTIVQIFVSSPIPSDSPNYHSQTAPIPPSVRRMSAPRAPSAAATATASSNPPDQIMHSMKRQLPFSSMKPPFAAAGDYHRFAPDHRRLDAEAVVVKTPVSASLILFFIF